MQKFLWERTDLEQKMGRWQEATDDNAELIPRADVCRAVPVFRPNDPELFHRTHPLNDNGDFHPFKKCDMVHITLTLPS